MEWTDIKITVPKASAEAAEAIATGISGGGIYIEDYSDLEAGVRQIAHVDLIEPALLAKDREHVTVHLYLAPDENPAEVLELLRGRPGKEAFDAAFGTMMGRFLGTVCKLGTGSAMVVLTARRIWPDAVPVPPPLHPAVPEPGQVVMLLKNWLC